jgi:hypothetical protein
MPDYARMNRDDEIYARDTLIVAGLLRLLEERLRELRAQDDLDPADLDPERGYHTPDTSYLEVRHPNGSTP